MIVKMGIFRTLLLVHEDFVSHLCNFIMILSSHNETPMILNFCRKIFTSLS